MNIQIFGKSKCFDTKKAERWFKERRIRFQSIDLGKYGISPGALTSVPPAPMTPGTIITEAWAYEENGRWEQVEGEWIHLPANEGAELLLWIEHAEELCR